jgi:2-polyprenyl-3-methyl-5-hydroxy-6-metoxy-1,4-benzoquinol methylase
VADYYGLLGEAAVQECMSDLQKKQDDWKWQWERFEDKERWLFSDWIFPNTLEDFRGKRVLDAGCGGGQHTSFVAPYAAEIVAADLNALDVAKERTKQFTNIEYVEGDIAKIQFDQLFDIVYCVGVIHHTDDPDATFKNLASLTKPGGRTIVWCYSYEGNFLNRVFVEGAKRLILMRLPKPALRLLSKIMTALVYLPVYTIYFLPLRFLPYYEYFQNWRKLSFERNDLNVFDKLNAPQTDFIKKDRAERWFTENGYRDISVTPYVGVSWRASGTKI